MWQAQIMIQAFIYGLVWAGMVMLFDYCMWEGNIFSWYYDLLKKSKYKITKMLGLCCVCFGFWFGLLYNMIDYKHYFVFVGISEMILIFYTLTKLFLNKEKL